jgi:SAM-dependent methyltransferase
MTGSDAGCCRSRPWYAESAGFSGARFLEEYAGWMGPEYTISQIRFVLGHRSQSGIAILDVGCGNGRHLAELVDAGFSATGLDLNPVMLVEARQGASKREWNVVGADMRHIPFRRAFDTAISPRRPRLLFVGDASS